MHSINTLKIKTPSVLLFSILLFVPHVLAYQTDVIPASYTGTGYDEHIAYQIPSGYTGAPTPLVVAWHSYMQSEVNMFNNPDFTVDEKCEQLGWIVLGPRCVEIDNFGFIKAQKNCTAAIKWLKEQLGYNIDTNQIYMLGFSMGANSALSYACRHMSEGNGYPIAGVISVSANFDYTHAVNSGDGNMQQALWKYLQSSPGSFKYKQISTLTMGGLYPTYEVDESMGQNMRHQLPLYIIYTDLDKRWTRAQNGTMIQMLTDLNGTFAVKHYTNLAHSWKLLKNDIDNAFSFIGQYDLAHQVNYVKDTANEVCLLIDRDSTHEDEPFAKFYWTELLEKYDDEEFAKVVGNTFPNTNTLKITEAWNAHYVDVDRAWAELNPDAANPLYIEFDSTYPAGNLQVLSFSPITSAPAYLVYNEPGIEGKIYWYSGVLPGWWYQPSKQRLHIFMLTTPASVKLKASFETYGLSLVLDPNKVQLGGAYDLTGSGGGASDSCILLFSLYQEENEILPNRHLLVPWPDPSKTLVIHAVLNGSGNISINDITVPNDGSLHVGDIIYHQFLTYDTALKEISNLAGVEIIP
jgi:predicted esterase